MKTKSFKQLVNNPFKYWIGRIIMPILGFIFNFSTFLLFYSKTYYFFFNHLSYMILKDLLRTDKSKINLNDWRGYKIILWKNKRVSIHSENEGIVSTFSKSQWDRNLNEKVYNHLMFGN
jgi:hypothetical protein